MLALACLAQQFSLDVPIRAVAQDAGKPVPLTWIATEGGIFRSAETGPLWRNVYVRPAGLAQPIVRRIHIVPNNPQAVYLVSDLDSGGIWRTVDGGLSWAQANTGLPASGAIDTLIALPNAPLTFYTKVGNRIFKTVDGATNWTALGTLPGNANAFEVDRANPSIMFASLNNGVFRSRDEGANWTFSQTIDLKATATIASILVDPSDPAIVHMVARGPRASGAGFYRSRNGGERFEVVVLPADREFILPTRLLTDPTGRIVYAGADENGVIYFTIDKGATWGSRILGGTGAITLAIDPNNPQVILAGTSRGLFVSTSSGERWNPNIGLARPTLSLPAQPLDFVLPAGGPGRLQLNLQVLETNRWTLPLTASVEGGSWLSLTGASATTTPATPSLNVTARELEPGEYNGAVRVDAPLAGNSPLRVPVKLTVVLPRPVSQSYRIATIAGNGQRGNFGEGQPAARASFSDLDSAAIDRDGNIFISDPVANVVRRIGQDGVITRFAGNGARGPGGDGGAALLAQLNSPSGIALDAAGNLYIVDTGNGKIRRVTADGATISTFASGVGPGRGIAVDSGGNVFLAVPPAHALLRITPTGQIGVYAGDPGVAGFRGDGGSPAAARLSNPVDLFIDRRNQLFIADSGNHRIRRVTDGVITTIAGSGAYGFQGDGPDATKLAFASPAAVAADEAGNVYVADTENNRLRMIAPNGLVRTLSGTGVGGFSGDNGPALRAQITGPQDVIVEAGGTLLSVEPTNLRIRRLTPPPPQSSPVISEGPVNSADQSPRLAPGTIFRLRGSELAVETLSIADAPWPIDLGGARVTLNGTPIPLSQVSPTEIVGLIPFNAPLGAGAVQVIREEVPSREVVVTLEPAAPALLPTEPGRALATNENGAVNSADQPAAPESLIKVYLTGVGLTENPPVGGAGAGDESKLLLPVLVQFGDLTLEPLLARLSPGRVGVAEVQFRVPIDLAGDYPVSVRVGDIVSGPALVSVGIK